MYSGLGRGEPAVHHALRCLQFVESGDPGFDDWDLASALEVVARAYATLGDVDRALEFASRAAEAVERIEDPDDRKWIAFQLSEIKL